MQLKRDKIFVNFSLVKIAFNFCLNFKTVLISSSFSNSIRLYCSSSSNIYFLNFSFSSFCFKDISSLIKSLFNI